MRSLRFVFAGLLALCAGFSPVQAAFAGNDVHYAVRLRDATIPWAITIDSACPAVPDGIAINPDDLGSDKTKHVFAEYGPEGLRRAGISDLVTGTATDNHGAAYKFLYYNVSTYHYDGAIVDVHMRDLFIMDGDHLDYTVTFNWRWAFEADSFDLIVFTDDDGNTIDIFVDPFLFATNDGVTESPDIVPGSWEQLSTGGDPFNCDPL